MLSVGGLFSGIGGWELGLERAGMRVAWHCEADPYAQRVLEARWPGVPCYPDVCELRVEDVEPVDVICGGFPCQDISLAGRGAGIAGERSGLWAEMFRLTRDLRPRYLLVENVAALVVRGLDVVLADLASIGFDAEWDCLRASDFGAPHQRNRLWLVAYPNAHQEGRSVVSEHDGRQDELGRRASRRHADRLRDEVADADEGRRARRPGQLRESGRGEPAYGRRESAGARLADQWAVEPDVGRVAHGVPHRVDRVAALGNALVPQIAEWIGRRIAAYEAEREELAA